MKEITIREFQLKASQYLKDMPLVLTRYGRPVAEVIPYEDQTKSLEHEILKKDTVETLPPIEPKEQPEKEETEEEIVEEVKQAIVESEQIEGKGEDKYGLSIFQKEFRECQEHYAPGVNNECYLTSFTNVDGTKMWTKWLCQECFETLYGKVEKYGGSLAPSEGK